MALRGAVEVAGGHRRVDRAAGRNDPRHCIHDRRRNRQPDNCRRDRGHSAGDCGIAVVLKRDFLAR